MKQYQQCLLQRGTRETVGWIEARGAKTGVRVEVLPSREIWTVAQAFEHALPENTLKALQQMHRKSLASIEPMA